MFLFGSSHKKGQKVRFTPPGLWLGEGIHTYSRESELGAMVVGNHFRNMVLTDTCSLVCTLFTVLPAMP